MTTDEILFGVGLTFVLAVGSQVIAALIRVPALILLLPAGFTAGALTDDVDPNRLLGPAFQPLVSLAVALILYDAGVGLKLRGDTRRVVSRLVVLGVSLSWASVTLLALLLLGMSADAALMLGAILVVSGPTVVGPLLAFVRPTDRLGRILTWEASLVDPIGGLLGAVVFAAVRSSAPKGVAARVAEFLASLGVGLLGAAVGTALLWLLLCKIQLSPVLGSLVQVACVVAVAAACDIAREDSGLIAAILMGLAVNRMPGYAVSEDRPFAETLVQLIIGLLFVSISATVTPASVRHIILPTLGMVAVLVLVTRPLVAWLATLGSGLPGRERAYIGWMDPRGIVAAASASTFAGALVAAHVGGASKILPATFLVIAFTVAVYGLTAVPVAERLGVSEPGPDEHREGDQGG